MASSKKYTFEVEFKVDDKDIKKSISSLDDLKSTISELEKEASGMDLGSEAFEETKNKIDELKAKYGELSKSQVAATKEAEAAETASIKAREEKYMQLGDNIEKFAKGVTDVFAGVMIAFGASGESAEEFQKTLAKGIGIATAVKGGIEAMFAGYKLLGQVMPVVSAGVRLFNAALAANPVLLIVAGIAALVAGLAALFSWLGSSEDASEDAAAAMEELGKQAEQTMQQYEKLSYSIQFQNKILEDNAKTELELIKLRGGTNKEIAEAESKLLNEKIAGNQRDLKQQQESLAQIKEKLSLQSQNLAILEKEGDISGDYEKYNKALETYNATMDKHNELIKKIDQSNLNTIQLNNQVKIQREKNAQAIVKDAEEERKQIEETKKKEADALKERQQKWKEYSDNRINYARQLKDLEISLIQDDNKRQEAEINERYKRQIEDVKANEKLLADEKKALVLKLEANLAKDLADLQKKIKDDKEKKKLENTEKEEEKLAKKKEMQKNYNAFVISNMKGGLDKQIAEEKAAFGERKAQLDEFLANGIITKEQYDQQYEKLKKQSEERITQFTDEETQKRIDAKNKEIEKGLQITEAGLNAAKGLTDLFFGLSLQKAKGNAAKELELKKKQFKVEKAFNIVRATIDGVRSVQAALTQAPPLSYVLAAFNGVLAAANIAKIATAKFDGGGADGGGGGGSVGSAGGAGPSAAAAPVFNPQTFGINSGTSPSVNSSTTFGNIGKQVSQMQPQKVYVVESDMTNTQKKVEVIQNRATIG